MFVITNRKVKKSKSGVDLFGKSANENGSIKLRLAQVNRLGRMHQ